MDASEETLKLFGDSLSEPMAELRIMSAVSTENLPLIATLTVWSPDGEERTSLPVTFTKSWGGLKGITLTGYSSHSVLTVTCLIPKPGSEGSTPNSVNLAYDFPAGKYPDLIEDAMALVTQMRVGDYLTLTIGKSIVGRTHQVTKALDSYVPVAETVLALARLQEHTGQRFPMPHEFTGEDRRWAAIGAALVQGETVPLPWQVFRAQIFAGKVRDFLAHVAEYDGAAIYAELAFYIRFAGRTIPIGPARLHCAHTLLVNRAELEAVRDDPNAEPHAQWKPIEGEHLYVVLGEPISE